ncbi:hypothetical protein FNV43_RR25226 [Rhamnella rubrinervis]|uniref:Uncharacterized protein n=1 Tax=Rhamnella rubrinervis TaxID=2594499 RepID=A0A8K0DS27_9ROSA|nr:hypothetical protein FNV43_RR25226 [Rhamnella rubrinervis]
MVGLLVGPTRQLEHFNDSSPWGPRGTGRRPDPVSFLLLQRQWDEVDPESMPNDPMWAPLLAGSFPHVS